MYQLFMNFCHGQIFLLDRRTSLYVKFPLLGPMANFPCVHLSWVVSILKYSWNCLLLQVICLFIKPSYEILCLRLTVRANGFKENIVCVLRQLLKAQEKERRDITQQNEYWNLFFFF